MLENLGMQLIYEYSSFASYYQWCLKFMSSLIMNRRSDETYGNGHQGLKLCCASELMIGDPLNMA